MRPELLLVLLAACAPAEGRWAITEADPTCSPVQPGEIFAVDKREGDWRLDFDTLPDMDCDGRDPLECRSDTRWDLEGLGLDAQGGSTLWLDLGFVDHSSRIDGEMTVGHTCWGDDCDALSTDACAGFEGGFAAERVDL